MELQKTCKFNTQQNNPASSKKEDKEHPSLFLHSISHFL